MWELDIDSHIQPIVYVLEYKWMLRVIGMLK